MVVSYHMGFRLRPHHLVTLLNVRLARIVFPIPIYVQHAHRVICIKQTQMSEFPVPIYGGVPSVLPGHLLPAVALLRARRVLPEHLPPLVAPAHATRVLPGHLHRHRVKVAVRLVPLVCLVNMCIAHVIYKAIRFAWVVPLLRIAP